jgi:hypothetical protein
LPSCQHLALFIEYPDLSLDTLHELINNYVSDCNQIHQTADRQFQYYIQFQLLDVFRSLFYFNYHYDSNSSESHKISTLDLISRVLVTDNQTQFRTLQEICSQLETDDKSLLAQSIYQDFNNKNLNIRVLTAYIFSNLTNTDLPYWHQIFLDYIQYLLTKDLFHEETINLILILKEINRILIHWNQLLLLPEFTPLFHQIEDSIITIISSSPDTNSTPEGNQVRQLSIDLLTHLCSYNRITLEKIRITPT